MRIKEPAPPAFPQAASAEAPGVNSRDSRDEATARPEADKQPRADARSVRALADRGRLAEAQAACEEAIAADKLDAGLYYLHATILQERNLDDEAIVSLKRALYLDQDFALAHFAMGNMLMRRGNARAARRYFGNALDILNKYQNGDALPESEGLTADRFREIINATIKVGISA